MPTCISCGREMPPPPDQQDICAECRAAIEARSPGQIAYRSRRSVLLSQMPLTAAIIGLNVVVFLAMTFSGVSLANPGDPDLVKWGANTGFFTVIAQPWRMLTSNYVHIGLLHIALNMWCLFNLGALAERLFDRWTYFLTYTLCGLSSSLVSVGFHPVRYSAGASGAIFGLAGALISALYLGKLPVHPRALKATLKSLVLFAVYNLVFGAAVPAIDNSAHIGGLLSGLLLGAALAPRLTAPADERNSWRRFVFLTASVLFAAAFYLVRRAFLHKFGGVPG